MGETEYAIFLIIASLILLVFISGIVIFIFQYYKRKLEHEREKNMLHEQHAYDLLSAKVEIQQHTMQDIGREIHDNVGQKLTLASIYLNQLVYENRHSPQQVATVGKIIEESLGDLRSLSKNLTGTHHETIELADLIENECSRVAALGMCNVNCSVEGTILPISPVVKNFILRIVQEFLQNSLKHANCTTINLNLNYDNRGLTVKAEDNGTGFSAGEHNDSKGIGLMNMRKRAELIGADFSFYSAVNKGTVLKLFVPSVKLQEI